MTWSLLTLRQELARSLDSLVTGTVTGGTTLTVVDSLLAAVYRDDHFIGAEVYIYDTTDDLAPMGERRSVSDFTAASGTFTVPTAFSVAPAAGDKYDVYLRYTKEAMDYALMMAVKDWRLASTLTISPNQAEYTLSMPGLLSSSQIAGMWIYDPADVSSDHRNLSGWNVWDSAGAITLGLDTGWFGATDALRVEYLAEYEQLKVAGVFADAATVGGDLFTLLTQARAVLFQRLTYGSTGVDFDRSASLYRDATEQAARHPIKGPRRKRRARMQAW